MCFLQVSDVAMRLERLLLFFHHLCDMRIHMTFTKTLPSFLVITY